MALFCQFSVRVERVRIAISNPRVSISKVSILGLNSTKTLETCKVATLALKMAVLTCSIGTSNLILNKVAVK